VPTCILDCTTIDSESYRQQSAKAARECTPLQRRDRQRRRADAARVVQVVGKRADISIEHAWGFQCPSTLMVAIGAAGGYDAKALEEHFDSCGAA